MKSRDLLEVFYQAIGEPTSNLPRTKAVQRVRRSSLSFDKQYSENVRASPGYRSQGKPYRPDVEQVVKFPCWSVGRSLAMWRPLACEWWIGVTAGPQATASRYAMQGNTRKTDRTAVSATEDSERGCTCGYDHANPCRHRCEVWR